MNLDILRPDKPPKHLSPEAKRIWKQMNGTWVFEPDSLLVLRVGLEAFDRLQDARVTLDAEGLTVTNKTAAGESKTLKHPALEAEKNARSGFLQAMRLLGLEQDPSVKNTYR